MSDEEFGAGFGLGGIVGTILGMGIMTLINSCMGPQVKEAVVFKEEGKPAVMRLYVRTSADQIMVENLDSTERYIPLPNHLHAMYGTEGRADRELEEARIKKQVRWYEE